MIPHPRLNLDILDPDQRAELLKELGEGVEIVITERRIFALDADGNEIKDAHLDLIAGVLRYENPNGYYRLGGDEGEAFTPGVGNLVSDIWAKRTGQPSDADHIAALRNGSFWDKRRGLA